MSVLLVGSGGSLQDQGGGGAMRSVTGGGGGGPQDQGGGGAMRSGGRLRHEPKYERVFQSGMNCNFEVGGACSWSLVPANTTKTVRKLLTVHISHLPYNSFTVCQKMLSFSTYLGDTPFKMLSLYHRPLKYDPLNCVDKNLIHGLFSF
jgi:hypothetical protein